MNIPNLIAELRDSHQITFTNPITEKAISAELRKHHPQTARRLLADLLRHQIVQQRCGDNAAPAQQQ